ncbi:MAG: Uma2 family endonuclease [Planctomycetes bacterium]|nr:Uma2 family endonuclease [Planctomycetota bacterium]
MTTLNTDLSSSVDHRIVLRGATWADYERLLEIRGEWAGLRITYLEGTLELMSPSLDHEVLKTLIGRLVEAWADETDVELNGCGSWTIRSRPKARGVEPDECYVLGAEPPERPDFAIEVQWSRGGIDKLEVHRGLGVPEVWIWIDGRIHVHALRGEHYVEIPHSELLPTLDLAKLATFLTDTNQSRAVRAWRESLRRE